MKCNDRLTNIFKGAGTKVEWCCGRVLNLPINQGGGIINNGKSLMNCFNVKITSKKGLHLIVHVKVKYTQYIHTIQERYIF